VGSCGGIILCINKRKFCNVDLTLDFYWSNLFSSGLDFLGIRSLLFSTGKFRIHFIYHDHTFQCILGSDLR
jgi:hypothetical protein